jgi:hypothetical protein
MGGWILVELCLHLDIARSLVSLGSRGLFFQAEEVVGCYVEEFCGENKLLPDVEEE